MWWPGLRHIAPESQCEMCGASEENLFHVIFECPVAKRFWVQVKNISGVSIPSLHPSTWAMDVLQEKVCSPSVAAMVVCGAWSLWTGRNALLQDLASLKVLPKTNRPSASTAWQRPEEGWVKVNTDAAFDATMCTGSAGVVIRDHDGLVLAAASRWLGSVPDVLTTEALAAREGLELALECGFEKAIIKRWDEIGYWRSLL